MKNNLKACIKENIPRTFFNYYSKFSCKNQDVLTAYVLIVVILPFFDARLKESNTNYCINYFH